jgi:hypothetical protein
MTSCRPTQVAALENAKVEKEVHGAFESECPGGGRAAIPLVIIPLAACGQALRS